MWNDVKVEVFSEGVKEVALNVGRIAAPEYLLGVKVFGQNDGAV